MDYRSVQCRECFKKSHPVPADKDHRPEKKFCIDCGTEVNQKSVRCRVCYHNNRKGKTPWNLGNNIDANFCIDCSKPIQHLPRKRCRDCNLKYKRDLALKNRIRCIDCGKLSTSLRCSKCSGIHRRGMAKAEKNGNWKDGITSIRLMVRHLPEYREWRTSIFFRDNYVCQICGRRGCYLEADHYPVMFCYLLRDAIKTCGSDIELIRKYKPLWKAEGRTVCKSCHPKYFIANKFKGEKIYED